MSFSKVILCILFYVICIDCKNRICESIVAVHVRSPDVFKQKLSGCTEIFGSLVIGSLYVNKTFFEGISFPELKSIKDYFVMFNVQGLISIGQLFPNLAVIRGEHFIPNTFISFGMDYMSDLNEVGYCMCGSSSFFFAKWIGCK